MLFLMKCGPLKMETAYLFSNSPTARTVNFGEVAEAGRKRHEENGL